MIRVNRVKGGFAAFGKFNAVLQTDKNGAVTYTNTERGSAAFKELRKAVSTFIKGYYS